MKKQILLFLTIVLTITAFVACNNDDKSTSQPIVGTWKLVERYTNGTSVSLSSCQMEETYIFGPEQFTHELYENGGKPGAAYKSTLGHDDDDDGGDDSDDSSDDDDDDDSDDDHSGGGTTTDDDSDDSGSGSGNGSGSGSGSCVNSERAIGYWTSLQNEYTLTVESVSTTKSIYFTDANNRFYIETSTTLNGTTVITRNVFQKQ